jgi:hypothetical protein
MMRRGRIARDKLRGRERARHRGIRLFRGRRLERVGRVGSCLGFARSSLLDRRLAAVRPVAGLLGRREAFGDRSSLGGLAREAVRIERRWSSGLSTLPGRLFGAAPFAVGAVALAFRLGALRRGL